MMRSRLVGFFLAPGDRDWVEAMAGELGAIDRPSERMRFVAGAGFAVLRLSARRLAANCGLWAIALLIGLAIPIADVHKGAPCLLVPLVMLSCLTISFAAPYAAWRWALAVLPGLLAAPFHTAASPFLDRAEWPAILSVAFAGAYIGVGLRWLARRYGRLRPVALLLALLPANVLAQSRDPALSASLDSLVRAEVARARVPGVAVLVERGGDRLLDRGYGVSDLTTRTPVTAQTVFPIGSITKQFTAAVVMQQVVSGKLSLDSTIANVFPDVRLDHRITIRHMLNHTSGLPRYEQLIPNVIAFAQQNIRPDTVLHYIAGKETAIEPGSRWAYINTGYHLLGLMLERRAGLPYFELLQRDVLRPLGLRATRACAAEAMPARGYELEEKPEAVPLLKPALPYAAGGLCSTTGDLAIWLRALTSGRVIPADAFATMSAPTMTSSGSRESYGFGLLLGELSGKEWIAHGGSLPGYDSFVARYPAEDVTIVILANGRPFDSEGLQKRLARRVLGIPEPRVVDLPISPTDRAAYVGTYDAGVAQVRIVADGQRLKLQGPGDFALLHQGNRLFVAREDPDLKVQFILTDGIVTGLTLTARGRDYRARRIQ